MRKGDVTTATATVISVERRVRPGLVPSLINPAWTAGRTDPVEGWEVKVRTADGEFHFSQLDGETAWTVDAFIPAGTSMPMFMHGFGSRCTIPRTAGESLAGIIDRAVNAVVNEVDRE